MYITSIANTLKKRYQNYKTSVTNKCKRQATGLSIYIWSLKDRNINYIIKLIRKEKTKTGLKMATNYAYCKSSY